MGALDDLLQGGQGSQLAGGIGQDTLQPQGGGGLFGMSPYQQQVLLMSLAHMGQNMQAAASRGRIAPQPFPAGALALLHQNQQREQARADQDRQLQALAASLENNPNVPPEMRGALAAMTRAGNMAGVEAVVAQGMKPRMVERNIGGNIVFAPEDGRGPVQPVGRAAEQWAPDPQNPEMMVEQTTGKRVALDETPSQAAARQQAAADAQYRRQGQLQDRADDRQAQRDAAAAGRAMSQQEAISERNVRNKTAEFAGKLNQGKLPTLQPSINAANSLMANYVQRDDNGNYRVTKPIPGIGPLTDARGAPLVLSEEGKRNRAAVTAVVNDLLALYSGLAVTEPEALRRAQQMMSSGSGYTDQDFINAWKLTLDHYNNTLRNFKAGYGEDVVNRYSSQSGAPYLGDIRPFTPGYQINDTIKGKDGKLYRVTGTDIYNPEVEAVR